LNNLAHGIVERVLRVRGSDGVLRSTPAPKEGSFERLASLRTRLVASLNPTTVVSRWGYPALYTGRKRAIYQRAAESLKRRGITTRDAIVNTFVKAEKIIFKAVGAVPRVIQPRSARYILEVGRYLKKFEKELIRGFERTFGYCVIVKGKNATETAECIYESWGKFRKPMAVGLDASRFDQHVSQDALRFEHSVYNAVFTDPYLAWLLEMQLVNQGRAYVGDSKVSYTTDGCRMSGDLNTGMGNCLIMSLIVLGYFQYYQIDARLVNNGDDCVVICEADQLHKLGQIDEWFLDFGFKLTREAPVYVFEEIEFCQAHPVWTESGYRMTRNPHSAASKDLVSLQSWQHGADVANWRAAIGRCGFELSNGVPFWQSFYEKIGTDGGNQNVDERVRESGLGFMAKGVKGCSISEASRISFWRAFGMLPDTQLELESEPWSIPDVAPVHVMFADIENDIHNSLSLWSRSQS
jgi:hypothetical protein